MLRVDTPSHGEARSAGRHGGASHTLLMVAWCIPMLALAGMLVATGAAGPGFILVAVACVVMMALMMAGGNRGHG